MSTLHNHKDYHWTVTGLDAAPGHRPFVVTHIDHIGPFVTSTKKNQYILVIVDNLTKFVCLEPCRNTKAADVVKRMEDFVHKFGAPERLISDRGTCFTSTLFEEFCKKHGIRQTLNSPRHAQANGQVERVNRALVPVIQANLEEGKFGRDWDRNIKYVALALNTSFNRSTTKTPFELLYGYKHRCNDGITRLLTIEEERKRYQRPEQLQQEAREKILKEQELYKARYDQNRYRNVFYNIGDIVYLRTVPTATGESTKLQLKWRGPLVVYKLLPSDTYGVTDLQMDACGRRYASTAHVSQLKLWQPAQEDKDEEVDVMDENTNKAKGTAAENISQAASSEHQGYPDNDAFRSTCTGSTIFRRGYRTLRALSFWRWGNLLREPANECNINDATTRQEK